MLWYILQACYSEAVPKVNKNDLEQWFQTNFQLKPKCSLVDTTEFVSWWFYRQSKNKITEERQKNMRP